MKSHVCPEIVNSTATALVAAATDGLTAAAPSAEEVSCDTSVTFIWSLVVAMFCVGGMMGGSVVGLVSSSVGRWGIDCNMAVILVEGRCKCN